MRRALLLASLVVAAACGKTDSNAPPPPEDRPAAPSTGAQHGSMTAPVAVSAAGEARKIYNARCVTCHGATGRGDGAAAMSMQPKPRDYSDPAWQASVSDADLAKTILVGGAALGMSSMMPPAKDLADKPEVVAELVKLIRGFAAAK